MISNKLTTEAMDAAAPPLGTGPVTMVNLLWLRTEVAYSETVDNPQPNPSSALYNGYAAAFVEIARELGVEGVEAVYVGHRVAGLVAVPEDDWDDVVIVRYRSFADFRTIVESEAYARRARPHHRAAVANWRLVATVSNAL